MRLAACLESRPVAIALVAALIAQVEGVDGDFRNSVITAFGEAFNNVVMHGYRDRSDGILDVEADVGRDEMTLRLIDTGQPIDFAKVTPPDLDSMPEGGLGVFLIHALMDDVVYQGGERNVLTLTKKLSKEPDPR